MTPIELELLLHCYSCTNKFPNDSWASQEARQKFIQHGILKDDENERECVVTERGEAFIKAILSTPYPVQKWVVERR